MSEIKPYDSLINQIGDLLTTGREQAGRAVNTILVQTYWQIGRHIVEYEQGGKEKAEYGAFLFEQLSKDLSNLYGKGFSRANLLYMRKLYLYFPKSETLSNVLSWFSKEINTEGDNPPIGIVLGASKDHILVEYATENITNHLFVSKYQLYLPDKKQLQDELQKLLEG